MLLHASLLKILHMCMFHSLLTMCTGELVWHRDTASEVRPVFLESNGLVAVAELVANTRSERVRLKALIIARRMLYEVGSSGSLDSTALKVCYHHTLFLYRLCGNILVAA